MFKIICVMLLIGLSLIFSLSLLHQTERSIDLKPKRMAVRDYRSG